MVVKKISLLILTLFLFSCSERTQEVGTTNVKILEGFSAETQGGAYLWGVNNSTGDKIGRVLTSFNLSLDLPNGDWEFAAMTWNSGSSTFEGITRCFLSPPISLNGGEVDLSLDLSSANCGNTRIHPDSFSSAIDNIYSCKDLSLVTAHGDFAACERDNQDPTKEKGLSNAFSFVMQDFDQFGGGINFLGTALESDCLLVQTAAAAGLANAADMSTMNLPWGDGSFPFLIKIRSYYGPNDTTLAGNEPSNCDNSDDRGFSDFVVEDGLSSSGTSTESYFSGNLRIFVQTNGDDICQGARLTTGSGFNRFAAGNGTLGSPYVICSPDQWNNITANIAGDWGTGQNYQDKDFELMNDLDFNYGTFRAIGNPASEATVFTGSIIGNNHKMRKILYLDDGSTSNGSNMAAIIRHASLTANDIVIKDIHLSEALIDCGNSAANCSAIGSVIGMVTTGANNLILENITIDDFLINGRISVGGLIGDSSKTHIKNSHVSAVLNGSDTVGGLVGKVSTTGSGIEKSSYQGEITTFGTGVTKAGGLVGHINATPFNISESKSEGYITGDGALGGLIGQIDAGASTVSHCYSTMSIYSRSVGGASVGGLIGDLTAGNTLTKSFHTIGSVFAATASPGSAGGAIGLNAGTCGTDVFYTTDAYNPGDTHGGINDICIVSPITPAAIRTLLTFTGASWANPADINTSDTSSPKFIIEDGADYPRLAWELERPCAGGFAGSDSGIGSGSASDPRLVCTPTQFSAMSSAVDYYKLGGHIDFAGSSPAQNILSTLDFNLDGDFKFLTNIELVPLATGISTQAIIGTIASGASLSNLKISGVRSRDTGRSADQDGLNMSLLADGNYGSISKIRTYNSKVHARSGSATSTVGLSFSGFVRQNFSTGSIDKVISNTNIYSEFSLTGGATASSTVNVAGVVLENEGTIKGVEHRGVVQVGDGATAAYNAVAGGRYSAFVHNNIGTIEQSNSRGHVYINNSASVGSSFASGFVYENGVSGTGTIIDSYSTTSINMNNMTGTVAGFINTNGASGTLTRTYYGKPGDALVLAGGTPTTNNTFINANSGTIDESFCLETATSLGAPGPGLTLSAGSACPLDSDVTLTYSGGSLDISDTTPDTFPTYTSWEIDQTNFVNSSETWVFESTTEPPDLAIFRIVQELYE